MQLLCLSGFQDISICKKDLMGLRRVILVKHALGLALLGVAVGTLFAAWLATALSRLLFEVRAIDPVAFFTGTLSLMAVALLASYFPARRATRIDPIAALHDE